MRKILVSLQQGVVDRELIPQLEAALRTQYVASFGPSPKALVIWCVVPRGQAYTEGRLADTCWLMVEVEDGLPQPAREQSMRALAQSFAKVTSVPVEKLMVTLCDRSLFAQYLAANRARVRHLPRAWFTLKLLWQIARSRRSLGYAEISANF